MDKCRVYIIGSLNSYQEELKRELEKHNSLQVSVYPDGETCFMSQDRESSMIIVDDSLGKGNWSGLEFMEEYKRIHPNTKFIVISTSLDMGKALEVVGKGALECAVRTKTSIKRLTKTVLKNLE